MWISSLLHRLLTYCRYILGGTPSAPAKAVEPELKEEKLIGTHGRLSADTVLMIQNGHVVLVVDHDFLDIPSFVEWDKSRKSLGIAQMGGAVAEVKANLPREMNEPLSATRTIMLMTRYNGNDVAHKLNLMVHD